MYRAVKKNIHYHSDSAASIQTVTGWVSRDGHFWGQDEHMARWSGCTHKTCECGKVVAKGWIKCDECREAARVERFRSLPERSTCGGMVYSDSHQRYFDDLSDAVDYAADEQVSVACLDLVCCKPTYMGEIYPDEIFEGDMPEDQCFADIAPKDILEKLSELNELIQKSKFVLSWYPDKFRVADDVVAALQAQLDADLKVLGGNNV